MSHGKGKGKQRALSRRRKRKKDGSEQGFKECGGSGFKEDSRIQGVRWQWHICEYGRQRQKKCTECGGGSIGEHGKVRSIRKECGSGKIC
jgi:hypothetical protein